MINKLLNKTQEIIETDHQSLLLCWIKGRIREACDYCATQVVSCKSTLRLSCEIAGLNYTKWLVSCSCASFWHKVESSEWAICRLSPPFVEGIWKHSFISTVRSAVHTNPSRKRSFSRTLFEPGEFENAGLSYPCAQKIQNAFWKRWPCDNLMAEFFSNRNRKW